MPSWISVVLNPQRICSPSQKAFDEADKKWQWYQSRSQRRGKTSSFRANLQGAWDDRENARLGLAAATLQSDMEKAGELAARNGLSVRRHS